MRLYKCFIGLICLLPLPMQGQGSLEEVARKRIGSYVDLFNAQDNELYKQDISNSEAAAFLQNNIPFFECPDKELEKTYYFRWWTYRKHIKKTPAGFVITEFLPDVPWAGKYNTISCAAVHHFYEGRWMKDSDILSEYAKFWFSGEGNPRLYSFGAADAIYHFCLVHGNDVLLEELYPKLKENFSRWEEEKQDSTGLFWQVDDRDGMEMSVSGRLSEGGKGYRPTINSYMYGEAAALAKIARLAGDEAQSCIYSEKAERLRKAINSKLWDPQSNFYKVIPRNGEGRFSNARELLGYIPWFYGIAPESYSSAWEQLLSPEGFAATYGPTTVEQRCPDFRLSYEGHECQWNGPSWPYLTSFTLAALANCLNQDSSTSITREDYLSLLQTYSSSHRIVSENNDTLCWIDENLNPYTGDWISRTRLKKWNNGTWDAGKGGVERGKDYNHSSFCDLVISGLMGVRPQDDGSIVVNPLVPDGRWSHFCLYNVYCQGKKVTIVYDQTGRKYGKGKGFSVYVDDHLRFHAKRVRKTVVK